MQKNSRMFNMYGCLSSVPVYLILLLFYCSISCVEVLIVIFNKGLTILIYCIIVDVSSHNNVISPVVF